MWHQSKILPLVGLLCCLTWGFCQAQDAVGKTGSRGEGRAKASGHWRMDAWGRGEEVVKLLEKLQKENPREFKRLEELRKNEPEQFYREVRSKLPRRSEWAGKINQVEQKCRQLAKEYQNAKTEAEKKRLEEQLSKLLKESFGLVINDALARIERLQKHVQEMQQNEEKILAERLQMFLQAEQEPPSAKSKR